MKQSVSIVLDLNQKAWLNLEEAIAYMGFGSKDTFQKWRDSNVLPFSKVGRSIVYRRSDIDRLLEDNMIFPYKYGDTGKNR